MPDTTEMNIIKEEELIDTPTYRAVLAIFGNPANDNLSLNEKAILTSNRVEIIYKHSPEGKIVLGVKAKIWKIFQAICAVITVAAMARIDLIIASIEAALK